MNELDDYRRLFREEEPVRPDEGGRAEAIDAAMAHFGKISVPSQETVRRTRLKHRIATIWNGRKSMRTLKLSHALMAGASLAAVTLLLAGSPALHRIMTEVAVESRASRPAELVASPAADASGRLAGYSQSLPAKQEPGGEADVALLDKGASAPPAYASEGVASEANRKAIATAGKEIDPAPAYAEAGRDRFSDLESNPVRQAAAEPLSTFSIDVDTSSYSFVRRSLMENLLPPKDAVRVEELVNYFPYDYEGPSSRAEPFKANVSLMQTPWNGNTRLMQIGIRGFSLVGQQRPRSNLVFLIDTSGSMEEPDKLPLLVNSFKLLLDTLSPEDSVAIVTYAGQAGTVLEPTPASDKGRIFAALDGLAAGGSTAGAEGIRQAYSLAERNFDAAGINRVILATDGDFNVGISDPRELEGFVERKRESGIYLSVLGFGRGNYNDELMQALAQSGNGAAAYIDTLSEARKVLVDEATSTLFPIANDVKIQVEFNPATVSEYRLIGYETRILDMDDFNNDRVDAGDIGAGHTVTALYEVTPKGSMGRLVDPLRYGRPEVDESPAGEYAFVKIRYKLPGESASRLITEPVTAASAAGSTEANFAAAVAAFGQILRGGEYTGSFGYEDVIALAAANRGQDEFGYRSEFIRLVRLAMSARAIP
ncbi:vWA domain-containing protein [Aestuariivirga sp.]|uniref:vWA domain-containing protein n=1 Tax=Aestuariivirga sp. TaxID=2650926 RepID=UPI00391D39AB